MTLSDKVNHWMYNSISGLLFTIISPPAMFYSAFWLISPAQPAKNTIYNDKQISYHRQIGGRLSKDSDTIFVEDLKGRSIATIIDYDRSGVIGDEPNDVYEYRLPDGKRVSYKRDEAHVYHGFLNFYSKPIPTDESKLEEATQNFQAYMSSIRRKEQLLKDLK